MRNAAQVPHRDDAEAPGGKVPSRLVAHWRLLGAATRDPALIGVDVAVLYYVLDGINRKTGMMYSALSTIATKLTLSRPTVVRSVRRLATRGYLLRDSGDSSGRANVYRAGQRRCTDEPRCTDDSNVGAQVNHPLGAQMIPLPALRANQRSLPAKEQGQRQEKISQDHPSLQSEEAGPESVNHAAGSKRPRKRSERMTFSEWEASEGQPLDALIPDDHAVFRYAESIALPMDFLFLAWLEFARRHQGEGASAEKTQASWPNTFAEYVRRGWLDVWRKGPDGYFLTTAGKQIAAEHNITIDDAGGTPSRRYGEAKESLAERADRKCREGDERERRAGRRLLGETQDEYLRRVAA